MRRLTTLLLCLVSATGALSGLAGAGSHAPTHAQTSVFAGIRAATTPVADSGREMPAADPAWTAPDPVVLTPVARGIAPHATGHHGSPIAAFANVAATGPTARDRSAAAHRARLQFIRRGYSATGPPMSTAMTSLPNSLARPA